MRGWAAQLGWDKLLNRAATTFRKLPEAEKQGLDAGEMVAPMLAQPSMIRRPLLDRGADGLLLGFDAEAWEAALGGTNPARAD